MMSRFSLELSRRTTRLLGASSLAACLLALGTTGTQNAIANGDTRTITIQHMHTKESATITFRRNGQYDREALRQLNWLLRDWRHDEPTSMDPQLFDIVWQVYRESGSSEPIHVVSAYRSPKTNSMLRRRSRGVAKHSQHMLGKAMDFYLPDVSVERIRSIGMRLQFGGVGYYPTSYTPFVHLDAGSVRSWPRMTRDQLARLFPNGRTVHIPADGRPMPGYDMARAEILSRGGSVAGYGTAYADAGEEGGAGSSPRRSLWAALFGGAADDEDADYLKATRQTRTRLASRGSQPVMPMSESDDAGTRTMFAYAPPASVPERSAPAERAAPPVQVAALAPQEIAPQVPEPRAAAVASNVPSSRLVPSMVPQGLLLPRPTALAESEPDAPKQAEPSIKLAFAPLPPLKPSSLAPAAAALALTTDPVTASAVPVPQPRPVILAGLRPSVTDSTPEIVKGIEHPLPPMRPGARLQPVLQAKATPDTPITTASLSQSSLSPPSIAQPSAGQSTDREALRELFATVATSSAPSSRPAVVTARTRKAASVPSVEMTGAGTGVATRFAQKGPSSLSYSRFQGAAVGPLN